MKIETERASYTLLENLGILINSELESDFSDLFDFENPLSREVVAQRLQKALTDEEINDGLSSAKSLVLGVTEQCNLRCKYCAYSGHYQSERSHGNHAMSFDTAVKAVACFFKFIGGDNRNTTRKRIQVGFYGGEPLLKLDLIKRVVAHIENEQKQNRIPRKFDIRFKVTTNGYKLDETFCQYAAEKDLILDVSLDGPKEEHDRFRVTGDHKPTWDRIVDNVNALKRTFPDYFHRNVNFLATVHPLHNGDLIDEFFNNSDLFSIDKARVSGVTLHELSAGQQKLIDAEAVGFKDSKLRERNVFEDLVMNRLAVKERTADMPFTGTCFPGGTKLYVDSRGRFHICEKINSKFPIGDVDNGIHHDKIRKIFSKWNEEILRNRCWECQMWSLCDVCFASVTKGEAFEFKCSQDEYKRFLRRFIENTENDELSRTEEKRTHEFETIFDYLEWL